MRPVRLKLRNFRSFLGEHTIRFDRDHNLVTIVGDIGTGKSTLLDGICYALYGVTPAIGRGSIASLIHNNQASAQVSLLFETSGGETWEAVRSIGANASHTLYQHGPDGTVTKTIMLKQHVDRKIEELVGLDFPSFGRVVLLAQGRFTEMLRASQTEREATLRSIMGLERVKQMRQATKTRRDRLAAEEHKLVQSIMVRQSARDSLAATKEQAEHIRQRLGNVSDRVKQWNKLQDAHPALQQEHARLGDWAEKAEQILSRADGDSIEQLETEQTQMAAETETIAADLDKAQSEWDQASLFLQSEDVRSAEQAEQSIIELRHRIRTWEQQHTDASAQLEKTRAESADLPARLKTVTAQLDTAKRAALEAAADQIRSQLTAGEPCPVCTQPAPAQLPASVASDSHSGQHVVELAAEQGQLKQQMAQAADTVTGLQHTIEATRKQVSTATTAIGEHHQTVRDLTGTDSVASLRNRLQALSEAHAKVRRRQETHAAKTRSVEKRYNQAVRWGHQAAALLATEAPETLTETERALRVQHVQTLTRRQEVNERLADNTSAQRGLVTDCEGQPPPVAEARLRAELEAVEARLGRLEEHETEIVAFEQQLGTVRTDLETYQTLYDDLADHRMVRWLLDGERTRLAGAADRHMRHLTDNKYGVAAENNDLMIVDGDILRDPSTLSGGETFLASLALAFGLGETISRSHNPVHCFFLDEGFGSLDAAHIDQALDGVERMAMGDQLVVLVSHLQAVKERAENTIQLVRAPEGNTRQAGVF